METKTPLCSETHHHEAHLADLLGMTKSAVSHQLSALRAAHLVNFRREGKNVRYSLADDHVRKIIECASEHLSEDD